MLRRLQVRLPPFRHFVKPFLCASRFNTSSALSERTPEDNPFYIPPKYHAPNWPRAISKSKEVSIRNFLDNKSDANLLWIHGPKGSGKTMLTNTAIAPIKVSVVDIDLSSLKYDVYDVVLSAVFEPIIRRCIEVGFSVETIQHAIEMTVDKDLFLSGLINHASNALNELSDTNSEQANTVFRLREILQSSQTDKLFQSLVFHFPRSLDVGNSLFTLDKTLNPHESKTSQDAFKALDISLAAFEELDCLFGQSFIGGESLPRDMQFTGMYTSQFLFNLLRNLNESTGVLIRAPETFHKNSLCKDFGAGFIGSLVESIESQDLRDPRLMNGAVGKVPCAMVTGDATCVLRFALYRETWGGSKALGEVETVSRNEDADEIVERTSKVVGYLPTDDWSEDVARKVMVPRFVEFEDHWQGIFGLIGGHVGDQQLFAQSIVKALEEFEEKEVAAVMERIKNTKKLSDDKGGRPVDPLVRSASCLDDEEDKDAILTNDSTEFDVYERMKYLHLEKTLRESIMDNGFLIPRVAEFEHAFSRAFGSQLLDVARTLATGVDSASNNPQFAAVMIETLRFFGEVEKVTVSDLTSPLDHPIVLALLKENILGVKIGMGGKIITIGAATPLYRHLLKDAAEMLFDRLNWKQRSAVNLRILTGKGRIRKAAENMANPWK